MSRADLDAIQAKLKAAIQSHQMLVMKLKSEPQNATMKDKLHELQTEIMNLSKEQKILVQELRQELMQNSKKSVVTSAGAVTVGSDVVSAVSSGVAATGPPRLLTLPPQTILPVGVMVPLAHVQAHSTLLAFPGVLNQPGDLAFRTDGQDQRHLLLNLQSLNNTAVTAAAAAAAVLHNNNNNIATTAVGGLKQPSPLETPAQPWRGSPPIKVPQYPISQTKPSVQQGSHAQSSSGKHDASQSNGFIHRSLSDSGTKDLKRCLNVETKDRRAVVEIKGFSSEEKKKMDFMACLDLVTPASLKEMQTRRVERKRRSTANPQFSYSFEPERRRGNSAWLNGLQSVPKKSRGRPFKPGPSPSNSRPSTPDSIENPGAELRKDLGCEGDNHEDVCAECGKEGKLLLCCTCTLVYHLDCLSPPLATVPPGPWSCPMCIVKGNGVTGLSNGALTMVHSYITAKAGKEEEKRKLQHRSTELLNEKLSLQEHTKRLQEKIVEQKEQKAKLTEVTAKTGEQVETLTNFVKVFQAPTTSVKLSETTA